MTAYLLYSAVAAVILRPSFAALTARSNTTMVYDFSQLTTSPKLAWTPCYDNFTCALLEVPLDYSNTSVGTVDLAIIKMPGDTPDAQEVLVNSGGPGGSSVDMVLNGYAGVQDKIGTQYSLVGIDPRGINNSGPASDCFPTDAYSFVARNSFLADVFTPADIANDVSLKHTHQSMLAYGKWCTGIYSINGTARYSSTVATAQDMLHYVELRAEDCGQPKEKAKLWYYGISYGSILGATFAGLYPDRVGRMVIDGTMDTQSYYTGSWEASVQNSDDAARFWFKRCFEAGPKLCAFNQNATSWEELEKRYWNLLHVLQENPIGIGDPISTVTAMLAKIGQFITPTVLTLSDVLNQMFVTSYLLDPTSAIIMDYILLSLQTGNVDLLSAITAKAQIAYNALMYDLRMPRSLVACLDSNRRANYTDFQAYKDYNNRLSNESIYGGLPMATYSGPVCSQLDINPPPSQQWDGVPKVNGTNTPILFISGIADPITPLPSAQKMHNFFPGSGLLKWNSSGHCAHFRESPCISKYEQQYMLNGTLPPPDTTCDIENPNPWIELAGQLNSTGGSTSNLFEQLGGGTL